MSQKECFVSVAIVLDSREGHKTGLFEYLKDLNSYLDNCFSDHEIVVIAQEEGFIDSLNQNEILKNIPSIRWLDLAFQVDTEVAFSAAIENSIGDYVVLIRPEIDPIDLVFNLVNESSKGFGVITGVANTPRTIGYKIFRSISNKLLESIDYHVPKNATSVRCITRAAINTILQTGRPNHEFFMKVSKAGYPSKTYEYKTIDNAAVPKRTLFTGIRQTLKLMVFNSTKPLRWISLLGAVGSFAAFSFAMYSILANLFFDDVLEGWTTLVFFSSIQFMVLFIILVFLGEYLARLLNESSDQRRYYIAQEKNSSVMLKINRLNVLSLDEKEV